MNKTFTRIFAGALAAASLFALASCGEKKDGDDKSANASTPAPITEAPSVTDEPTTAPTEAPTPEPTATPEPTGTPVPEGWYIDRTGNIPPEVEVAVYDYKATKNEAWCIIEKNGKAVLQLWRKMELIVEKELPQEILKAVRMKCSYVEGSYAELTVMAYPSEELIGNPIYYLELSDGRYIFFESTSYHMGGGEIILTTVDGKGIKHRFGTDYYWLYDFGPAYVTVDSDRIYSIDGTTFIHDKDVEYTRTEFNR